jgi:hypothetical protein
MNAKDLEEALEMGMDWSLREGYAWAEDKEHCEEYGRMLQVRVARCCLRWAWMREKCCLKLCLLACYGHC